VSNLEFVLSAAIVFCLVILGIYFWRERQRVATRLSGLSDQDKSHPAQKKIEILKKRSSEFKIALVVFVLTLAVVFTLNLPWHLSLVLLAVCGPLTWWLLKRYRLNKIRREFASYFPETVDSLNRAIQAGVPVERALASMAELYHGEIATRFRRLVQLLELGVPFREALNSFASRLNLPDVDFFCAILALNRESGSRLSPLLTSLSRTLRERQAVDRKLKGLTAESRGSARILMILPVIVIGLQTLLNPGHFQFLLTDPLGRVLLGYVVVSMLAGFLIIQRMSRLMEI
jgi:tight adherence protein B